MKAAFRAAVLLATFPCAQWANAIPISVVGEVDNLIARATIHNSSHSERAYIASYLGVESADLVYEKIDVGGAGWLSVDAAPNLYAFDFQPYLTDPLMFLVRMGNTTYTHFLYENVGSFRYGVIDLGHDWIDARNGKVTITSVSHMSAGGQAVNVPEPTTLSLLGAGLVLVGLVARRRRLHG